MIEMGFTKVEHLTKAKNWKGRVAQVWFHTKGAWYAVRYGGTKITCHGPNYITRTNALRLVNHIMKQYMEGKDESRKQICNDNKV